MDSPSILYVWDEEPGINELMQIVAQQRGYHFQHLTNFTTAWEQLHIQPPTIIIAKRSLDDSDDGLRFCASVRADPRFINVPIILGWADMGGKTFAEAYQAGANGCYGRVFDIAKVFTMIAKLQQTPQASGLMDQPEWKPRRRKQV